MNLGLGLRLRSVLSSGGAAPSGIPVASTTNLLITFNHSTLPIEFNFVNQAYTKFAYPTAYYLSPFSPDLIFDYLGYEGIWSFTYPDGDGGYYTYAQNSSANGAYIPTTGWTGGFTTFTITAA